MQVFDVTHTKLRMVLYTCLAIAVRKLVEQLPAFYVARHELILWYSEN